MGHHGGMESDPLLVARARVLRDLQATGAADPDVVSHLEDAVTHRRWWVGQWPEGAAYVAGLVAQDVQDRLLDSASRWPTCPVHDREALVLEPELDPQPRWVCYAGCGAVAPLGGLRGS
jgi:hypothetical protein